MRKVVVLVAIGLREDGRREVLSLYSNRNRGKLGRIYIGSELDKALEIMKEMKVGHRRDKILDKEILEK